MKIAATVDRKRFLFDALDVAERVSDADSLEEVDRRDESPAFASLEGTPVPPGLPKRIFALIGDDPAREVLEDALLMFASSFIQIGTAQIDLVFEEQAKARAEGKTPEVARLGGNLGASYMWRGGGPISKASIEMDEGAEN